MPSPHFYVLIEDLSRFFRILATGPFSLFRVFFPRSVNRAQTLVSVMLGID